MPLERQFQAAYLNLRKNYLRKVALIIGTVYFSIFFFDVTSIESSAVIITEFLFRLVPFALSLFFYWKPNYFFKSAAFVKITCYELVLIVSFFIIIIVYESPSFLFQALSINVIILGLFFVVPNLFLNRIMLSSLVLGCFITVAAFKFNAPLLEMIYTFAYLLLAVLFSVLSSYSLDKYARLDFVNKQYLMEYSTKDPLTNIYNRLKFNESLLIQIELAKRYGNTFSIVMFDIDHFKKLNDENGHIFGDKVLVEIAALVKGCVREVDIFARWGGEEFVILLPQTSCLKAAALAERLRTLICKESLQKEKTLTCSFGVTSFFKEDDEHSIMDRVDRALYRAKDSGRNAVVTECSLDVVSV